MKRKIAFVLIMGGVTTGVISFTLIALNIGFWERFLTVWIKSWVMAYVIVLPVILLVAPRIQKWVDAHIN